MRLSLLDAARLWAGTGEATTQLRHLLWKPSLAVSCSYRLSTRGGRRRLSGGPVHQALRLGPPRPGQPPRSASQAGVWAGGQALPGRALPAQGHSHTSTPPGTTASFSVCGQQNRTPVLPGPRQRAQPAPPWTEGSLCSRKGHGDPSQEDHGFPGRPGVWPFNTQPSTGATRHKPALGTEVAKHRPALASALGRKARAGGPGRRRKPLEDPPPSPQGTGRRSGREHRPWARELSEWGRFCT